MESFTAPVDQISIQDLIQLLVSATSGLTLAKCSENIDEIHDKQEYDEVEQPEGEYLEEGYVLVDRDPETKIKRPVDRAAATKNANKKQPKLNAHPELPIVETPDQPSPSPAPTPRPPSGLEHQALPIVKTPSQAPSAPATRPPPGLERRPLSEAQKVEVVMLEIDAEVISSKKNGDCQIWANLSVSDRELWSTCLLIYHSLPALFSVSFFF